MKRKITLIITIVVVATLGISTGMSNLTASCHNDGFCNSPPGDCYPPDWLLGTDDCWTDTCQYAAHTGECYVCYYVGP